MPLLPTLLFGVVLFLGCGNARNRATAPLQRVQSASFGSVVTPAPSDTGSLFSNYSETSPHWPHIRTMVTDFRTLYQKPPVRAAEIHWAARHFDYVMSGDEAAYKRVNPTIRFLPYALFWSVYVPGPKAQPSVRSAYYDDMVSWFAAHPQYSLEHAFLHQAAAATSPDTRVVTKIWDSRRYVLNPGDPGLRAYQVDRITRIAHGADGVFLDEFGSGGMHPGFKAGVAEYTTARKFDADMTSLLAAVKAALGKQLLMINTAEYMNDADRAMIFAAGAAHLERMNNPFYGGAPLRWSFIDDLLEHGVTVELVSLNSWEEANTARGIFATFTPGAYPSKAERLKMWELGSYYMVVPASPDHLMLDMEGSWKSPFSKVWLKAQEANIGHPRAARAIYRKGTDPKGQAYQVWERDFDRARVLVRPVVGWDKHTYDDATAVTVPLPAGITWRPLRADGTLGPVVTSVTLRSPEAAILIKEPISATP